jgi:hypothetical protein
MLEQETFVDPEPAPSARTVLTGTVSYAQGEVALPAEMYGTWQRTRTLIESSYPGQFSGMEMGYWTIANTNGHITLTNPETGASTTIHVQAVQGSTAKFQYHTRLADGSRCVEQLTLTAGDEAIHGIQQKDCSLGGSRRYHAVARVSGYRLDQGPAISIFR